MTCCVVALALAMQIIEAWRRCKSWLGIAPSTALAPRGIGSKVAACIDHLRHPAVRYTVFALLALEAALAGSWLYGHRTHVANEIAAVVFNTTGFAVALCDGDPDTAPRRWTN